MMSQKLLDKAKCVPAFMDDDNVDDGGHLVLNICSDDTPEPIDIDALLRGEELATKGRDKDSAITCDDSDNTEEINTTRSNIVIVESDHDNESRGAGSGDDGALGAHRNGRSSSPKTSVGNAPPYRSVPLAQRAKPELEEILYERGKAKLEARFKDKPARGPRKDPFEIQVELPPEDNEQVPRTKAQLFTDNDFSQLSIHPHIVGCLRDRLKITKATVIQQMSIPRLLERTDLLIKSPTGSGKTLAYALPILHLLMTEQPKITREAGTRAVIVTPTRELALQTYQCLETLSKACQWIVPGVLMGGEKKKSEKARIRKGIVVMIGTPGRLIDHLDHTSVFGFRTTDWLVVDEADRMLEMGFEQTISRIVQAWKRERAGLPSTAVLLSATLTPGVEKLAGLSLNDPVVVDATNECENALDNFVLPETLEQTFMVCPTKLYLVALSSLVARGAIQKDKIIVFLPTQGVVDFYLNLFSGVMAEAFLEAGYKVNFYRLHGTMSQTDRTEVFNQFRGRESGVLFTTDVASRGLDLPKVDLIVQLSLPLGVQDYVHRVGRTARIGTRGCAVLMLMPCQAKYLGLLAKSGLRPQQMPMRGVVNYVKTLRDYLSRRNPSFGLRTAEDYCAALQLTFESEVKKEPVLMELARNAFTTYIRSAASYPQELRGVAPFKELHLGHVAKMFCLNDPPRLLGEKAPRHIRNENKTRFANAKAAQSAPTKRKEISEYDNGLEPSKRQRKVLSRKT
ncbi:putative ATP-dependent RNA helicase DDX31-like [Tropilaelaps mercedesae]|uniref:ATP-dependent RNA helicase n=1 Tax=Tropilaelaps mercedesae TaxID=418985 RepID=A0A1V9Y261_9ACAR|nr:putative ATP-dependent RNA helicase DDX31-like [Tropilaelaps mercedesae]